jgi:hypothetical protein
MPKTQFMGRVLPATLTVNLGRTPEVTFPAPEVGLEMKFKIHINLSLINIECECNRFQEDEVVFLYMRAFDLCRAAVDLVGFATGYGLTVHLDTLIRPDGTPTPLQVNDIRLPALCTAYKLNTQDPKENAEFDKLYEMVLAEPPLFMAMNDLIAGITLPHHGAVNFARAIETLRHHISPPGSTAKETWQILRDKLNLDISYLQPITDVSTKPRHGDRIHISGATITDVCQRSWVVMNRYLEFRKRGGKPLPEAEFPVLKT